MKQINALPFISFYKAKLFILFLLFFFSLTTNAQKKSASAKDRYVLIELYSDSLFQNIDSKTKHTLMLYPSGNKPTFNEIKKHVFHLKPTDFSNEVVLKIDDRTFNLPFQQVNNFAIIQVYINNKQASSNTNIWVDQCSLSIYNTCSDCHTIVIHPHGLVAYDKIVTTGNKTLDAYIYKLLDE
jgi:hypothetical protein